MPLERGDPHSRSIWGSPWDYLRGRSWISQEQRVHGTPLAWLHVSFGAFPPKQGNRSHQQPPLMNPSSAPDPPLPCLFQQANLRESLPFLGSLPDCISCNPFHGGRDLASPTRTLRASQCDAPYIISVQDEACVCVYGVGVCVWGVCVCTNNRRDQYICGNCEFFRCDCLARIPSPRGLYFKDQLCFSPTAQ